ncbi:exosome complex RNA-binding protein Csl4 [Methanolapillus millepedarum]|uniref:Exosome complex component Csl4 n=1 Tax=Methanolapillus millepedarum TaxID=3028296 RepID=A0AA96V4G0_9EURY|nr:hypothetical protein MsAc7_09000 [Methanosarcinaceae archaeon Ac7]
MSRVQKKPIRRKLRDASSKTEEPKDVEETQFNRDAECEAPAQAPLKSPIPRKPRPQIENREAESTAPRQVREAESTAPRQVREAEPFTPKPIREKFERPDRSGERNDRSSGEHGKFSGRNDRNSKFGERGGERNGREKSGRDGGRGGRDGGRGGRDGKRPERKKRPEKVLFENTKQFAIPGDIIGAVEEFTPAFGAVIDDGDIRATVSGFVAINIEKRLITIIPKTNTPNTISDGDIVIASVTDVRESNARVELVAAEKNLEDEIVNNGTAEIYVSNIKDGFTKMVSDEFAVLDIVRAKVIDSNKIGLSTVDSDLGVIKAYCSKCKTSLTRSGDILVCPVCGNRERRKLAESYGKGVSIS